MKYEIVQPSKIVDVSSIRASKNDELTFDTGHTITISQDHPLVNAYHSGHAEEKAALDLISKTRLFDVEGQVVDYAIPSQSNREVFIHEKNVIQNMIDKLGFGQKRDGSLTTRQIQDDYSFNDRDMPGTEFNVKIGYQWSPFVTDVHTFTDLARMICDNLMSVEDPSLNYRIPLINAWDENIAIGNQSLRHSIDSTVRPRLKHLYESRISAYELICLTNALSAGIENNKDLPLNAETKVRTFIDTLWSSLGNKESEVRQLPSSRRKLVEVPIRGFDAFNLATEVVTHYTPGNSALNKVANSLIFGNVAREQQINADLDNMLFGEKTFNSLEDAFAGEACY